MVIAGLVMRCFTRSPDQLAHRYSVARARRRSVWLTTPTSDPEGSTTGSPEMWCRSRRVAATPSGASPRTTTGSRAMRSPTTLGALRDTTFTEHLR